MSTEQETKKWYQSLGTWGAILVIVPVVLNLFGAVDLATLVQEETPGILDWVAQALVLIGSACAFIGRIRAKKKIAL